MCTLLLLYYIVIKIPQNCSEIQISMSLSAEDSICNYPFSKIFAFSYHKGIKCFNLLPFLLLTLNVYLYFRNHFAKVHLRALSSEEIEAVRQKKYVPVASKLRFIPKANGLRPIVKVSGVVEARAFSRESRGKKVFIFFIVLHGIDVGS